MITFLDGKLVNALPTQAIVDVGGVGYEVFIPLSSYDKLPAVGQRYPHSHASGRARGCSRAVWIHDASRARSFPIAGEQRFRYRTEAGARSFERDERDEFQSGGSEF